MSLESVHQAAMWEAADDGNFEQAALHALRLGDLVSVRTTEGGRLATEQAQVFAQLELALAQREANRIAALALGPGVGVMSLVQRSAR